MINSPMEFWMGVVEDRHDPLKLGRCRVRILGYHTENLIHIKTKNLPWAVPIQSINSAAISGIGQSPTGFVEGTWVIGFFRDGKNAQEPVILGSCAGIPQKEADPNIGFNDPNGKYPLADQLGESDVNRLARNENIDKTIVETKKKARVKNVVNAVGGKWSEPEPPYNAVYPYNQVWQYEAGHVVEYDNTKDAERIHHYHKSGSFEETGPDGTNVKKIVGDGVEITLKDKKVYIKGQCDITVEQNANIYVKGDATIKVDGNSFENVGKTKTILAQENMVLVAKKRMIIKGKRVDIN